jgi:hypothetical protein
MNNFNYHRFKIKNKSSKVKNIFKIISNFATVIAIVALLLNYKQIELSRNSLNIADSSMRSGTEANTKMIKILDSISKSSGGLKNTFDYITSKLTNLPFKIDSITNSLYKLNSAINEQRIIAEKDFMSRIEPNIKYDFVKDEENKYDIKGFKIINYGEDIVELKIYKYKFFWHRSYGDKYFENDTYKNIPWKEYSELKHEDNKTIYFDSDEIDTLKSQCFEYRRKTESNICGVIALKLIFKRPVDMKEYVIKDFLIIYVPFNNTKICLISSPKINTTEDLNYLYNDIKELFDNNENLF